MYILEVGFFNSNILKVKKHTFKTKKDIKEEFKILNTKKLYSLLNNVIYKNRKIEEVKELSIDTEEEEEEQKIEKTMYKLYNNKVYEVTKKENSKINIEMLELTERQKEILLMYAKTKSYQKVADMLGVGKTTVLKTIQRIRQKVKVNI